MIEEGEKKYFRIVEETQKEIEIRIIIFYYSILILLIWLTYLRKNCLLIIYNSKLLNRGREKGERENFKKFSDIFKYHILYIFYKTLIYFLL